jgi:hypothetical protein
MVAKVHESYDAGQFLTGSLVHFTADAGAGAVDNKVLVEAVGTRATVVILGVNGGAGTDVRFAVENNGAWDAASLSTATGYTVTDFDY